MVGGIVNPTFWRDPGPNQLADFDGARDDNGRGGRVAIVGLSVAECAAIGGQGFRVMLPAADFPAKHRLRHVAEGGGENELVTGYFPMVRLVGMPGQAEELISLPEGTRKFAARIACPALILLFTGA